MYSTRSSLSASSPSLSRFLALVSLTVGCSAPFNQAENGAGAGGAPDDTADVGAGQGGSGSDTNAPASGAGNSNLAGAPATGAAGTAATKTADPLPLDVPAPHVVQMSPSDGASGVSPHARVTLRFSSPMDRAATEGALRFEGAKEISWQASWDASSTLLSLTPEQPLDCASATLADDQALQIEPIIYTVTLGAGALDVDGHHLESLSLRFKTPLHIQHTLHAVTALTGVVRSSDQSYGFLTYDLGSLREGARQILAARVHGEALGLKAPVVMYTADFSDLSQAASSAPGKLIGTAPPSAGGDIAVPASAFELFDGRGAALLSRGQYAQVRMDLGEDAAAARVGAALRASSLEVEYLRR